MEVIKLPDNPCPFCKRNEATQLCDFVIDYAWTTAKDDRGRMIGQIHLTCDNQMCYSCAKKSTTHEFCPICVKLYKMIQKELKGVGRPYIPKTLKETTHD